MSRLRTISPSENELVIENYKKYFKCNAENNMYWFCDIEKTCSEMSFFVKLDFTAYTFAKALVEEGIDIIFDDKEISQKKNVKKAVELAKMFNSNIHKRIDMDSSKISFKELLNMSDEEYRDYFCKKADIDMEEDIDR